MASMNMQGAENTIQPTLRQTELVPHKLTNWAKEPDVARIKQDLDIAKQPHDSQVTKINHWNDLLQVKGAAKPKAVKGRSKVQPKLIRRQAEWRYAALSEPFLSTDKMFTVNPATFEDAEGARQNELVINWQFRTKLNRVKFMDDLVRSVVDDGTGIVQIGWKRVTTEVEEEVPVFDFYALETEEELQSFQQALELRDQDIRHFEENADPALRAALDYYDETQEPVTAMQNGTQKQKVTKFVENKPTLHILNPQNFYIDPSCEGDVDKALFAVVSFETNQAELKKMPDRYKNLELVDWEGQTPITQPDHASKTPDVFQFTDALRKKVVAYEYWGFYDIHGDGTLVPIVCTWIGSVMIRMEENPFPDRALPFVMIPYLPVKRELYGEPDAEFLEDNQNVSGAIMRGLIDLMGRSANSQRGFAKGMLDPVNRRKYDNGEDYEFNPNSNPQNYMIEHKYPELPRSALEMLQIQNQEAEALTGVKSFSGGLSGDSYGDVAAGIRGALDAASKREMSILRRIAKGMKDIATKIMAMNAIFLSKKEVIRVSNQKFITIHRDDLAGNFDLVADIATAEVDNQKAQDMAFMLQTLGNNMDTGITLMILAEIAELKRMPELAQKIRSFKPQLSPEQQEMQKLQLEEARLKVEELRSKIELNRAKAAEAAAVRDKTDLDAIEQETGTKHARDMQKIGGQARANADMKVTDALLKPLKKPDGGETKPDIEAAAGWNVLSDQMNDGGLPERVSPTPVF